MQASILDSLCSGGHGSFGLENAPRSASGSRTLEGFRFLVSGFLGLGFRFPEKFCYWIQDPKP